LLGDEVRYDGGHKRDPFLTDILGALVDWVKVCPEVELGMGTPREPIHLIEENGRIRLRTVHSGIDHTPAMTAYAVARVAALAGEDLSGYVLKAGSPSCGMTAVPVHSADDQPTGTGIGLFAQALLARFPDLPIEDEQRLADPQVRERFLERVLAYRSRGSQGRARSEP
jgi:uncharacterized protein YbbK (DUF523 family)